MCSDENSSLLLSLRLFGEDEEIFEEAFSEETLLSQNQSWQIFRFEDFATFIRERIACGHFRIVKENETLRLEIWSVFEFALKEIKVEFSLNLKKKRPPGTKTR